MITLNNGTAAFLRRGDKYLLMKRAAGRAVAPGVWSGVGGHMERDELNDPQAYVLREIEEETGIIATQIKSLTLRYVILRRYCDVIRQTYVYFGETYAEPTVATDEGELFWVDESELLNREYTATFDAMLRHYMAAPDNERVIVGVAEKDGDNCSMVWAEMEDFE